MHKLLIDLRANEMTRNCFAFGDKHHVSVENEKLTVDILRNYLQQNKHTNIQISEIEPTIEDCFMQLSQN
jgi:hypothetical protein